MNTFSQSALVRTRAFTLIEIMVSTGLLVILLLILLSITNSASRTWSYTTERIEQFRAARIAFESMTRRISQATLNTYWDYDDFNAPKNYVRQSELRFICGPTETLLENPTTPSPADCLDLPRPGHGIFFQAPLGYVGNSTNTQLKNLLNTWGYFLEFNDDKDLRPTFLANAANPPPLRYRYRLMEMMETSEAMDIYRYTSGLDGTGKPRNLSYVTSSSAGANGWNGREWFTASALLKRSPPNARPVRPLAENIVAMVILPKLAPEEDRTGAALSPVYEFDSSKTNKSNSATVDPRYNWKHQLPPVVQVTLVAVDESSYSRFQVGSTYTNFTEGLFTEVGNFSEPEANVYKRDLETLQTLLRDKYRLTPRVFSTDVSIRAAKWSREQSN